MSDKKPLKTLRDHFLRIDARSLGVFRVAMGVVLVCDLFRRWADLAAFYSNEGVLPNHNHLFNLRETGRVWSFLHAFSTPGENAFAFALILGVYTAFLVGWKTRTFHLLSLVCLVALTGRNILLENAGNYLAIALLAFSAFLPTGSRFSVDALVASMKARDEKTDAELNDRGAGSPLALEADADAAGERGRGFPLRRGPGWSPVSLAAFALLVQVASVLLVVGLKERAAPGWRDGTALHFALHVEGWVSETGALARASLSPSLLKALSLGLHGVAFAVPALIVVPVFGGVFRALAALLLALYGLSVGVFFDFGLYGWSLLAASPLLLVRGDWEALGRLSSRPSRRVTLVYDADCGICLWLARLVRRLDLLGHVTFQGNDGLDRLLVRGEDGSVEEREVPAGLTRELAAGAVALVDAKGRVTTHTKAVALAIRALPLGLLGLPVALALALLGAALLFVVAWLRRIRDVVVAMGGHRLGWLPPLLALALGAGLSYARHRGFGQDFWLDGLRDALFVAAGLAVAAALGLWMRDAVRELRRPEEDGAPVVPGAFYDAPYLFVARRRLRISVALGMGACGMPAPPGDAGADAGDPPPSPATRLFRRIVAVPRELAALVLLFAMLAQTAHENQLPRLASIFRRPDAIEAIAVWPRMIARWDVLAGEPPREDRVFVVDAQTRGGESVDPLTGREPDFDTAGMRGTGMGQLWNTYLVRVHDPDFAGFQKAFRDYLTKGAGREELKKGDGTITGFDAYWVVDRSPAFGSSSQPEPVGREKLYTHSRGGRQRGDGGPLRLPNLVRPGLRRP